MTAGRVTDLGAYLREQRRRARLSLRKLSELAGVSNPYLSQIERGLRKPSARILQAISRALGVSSDTIHALAGLLEERSGQTETLGAIQRDPNLTEGQRQLLAEQYERYRRETAERRLRRRERRLAAAGDR